MSTILKKQRNEHMRCEICTENKTYCNDIYLYARVKVGCWDLYGGLSLLMDQCHERNTYGNITTFQITHVELQQKKVSKFIQEHTKR